MPNRIVALTAGLVLALTIGTAGPAQADSADAGIASSALDVTAPPTTRAALEKASPVTASHAMVVTAQHLATQVGVKVLRDGGNAVDAAVAVGYALAVVHPCCGNIGGGGFMVVHLAADEGKPARDLFLDFREKAPAAATPTLFQDDQGHVVDGRSTDSYLAVGVPGTVMGLEEARQRLGTMSRKRLMQPAIDLASRGFALTQGDVNILHERTKDFAHQPNVARIFLDDGKPYQVGDTLKQPQLAHTLRQIQKGGTQAFYQGSIAKRIIAASRDNGGILTQQDFADYTAPWGKPVRCGYGGYTVLSTPPPSSGGTTICEILGILDPLPLAKWGYGAVQTSHHLIEAERRAFADRNTYLGDPAFVDNPIDQLLSSAHLDSLRQSIDADRATPSSEIDGSLGAREGQHTTQYSIVDPQGNAVSVTYTINYLFGNGRIAGDTGFFLNNEMDDFTAKPGVPNAFGLVQGKANQVEGGKRPLSSMSPSMVLDDDELYMVTGSPGGSTIISTTLESMLNVIDFGMNIQQAVNAPRLHNQWQPDHTKVEPGYLTDQTRQALESMGHEFDVVQSWGADEAILRDPDTGRLQGANDRRRPAGLAAGF
ncbi:gamma-glutamyltransferase [Salinisphaera sp. Q1T1-3]|uniref:gamma-glutamyltransferase n=1 Tax=Salinisphaera sp. Q1T1-3 TaxID=2321229 RepID=UPI000E768879|nr:gamma-glutamyltransferase [Salinisphaera sp. Q1T1-3]RJS93087.1 gamma-glutamyltransferase [Salinisphaera sp. Q1T1-3]